MILRPRLVLASESPRRRDLLSQLGIDLDVRPARVDESVQPGEEPRAYVRRVAEAKARAVTATPREVVLAADTAVVLDRTILGKPRDPPDARRMLCALSGRTHEVLTGVFGLAGARSPGRAGEAGMVVATEVSFVQLSEAQIDWYLSTGEPFDKAGAYAVQGIAGAFVNGVSGSVSNVVGLPMVETLGLLASLGFPLPWEEP